MSVQVRVTEINRQKMQVTVEAYKGESKIFKSSMPYKTETRAHIESVLNKELEGLKYEQKFTHGTVYAYNKHKCRCEFCKEAKSISNQRAALKRAVVAQGVVA